MLATHLIPNPNYREASEYSSQKLTPVLIYNSTILRLKINIHFNYNYIFNPINHLNLFRKVFSLGIFQVPKGFDSLQVRYYSSCNGNSAISKDFVICNSSVSPSKLSLVNKTCVVKKVSNKQFYHWLAGFGVGKIHRNYFHSGNENISPIVPKMSYIDALAEKRTILQDNKDKSGVYRWINKETGESYVGLASKLTKRFRVYYSESGIEKILKISTSRILRALLKYGYSKFRLEILEYCDSDKCLEREQYYLDSLNPEYNILKKAGSSLGYKHTEKTIAKMVLAHKGDKHHMYGKLHSKETLALMSRVKLGKKLSEEARTKIAEAFKGEKNPMFNKKHSAEILIKMSASLQGRKKPELSGKAPIKIEVIDIKNNKTTRYDSISAAALALNIGQATISKYLARKDDKFYKKQFSFKKVF